jgi:DNA topoisomerase-1
MGKFGPYVKHDNKYVSIPKTLVPAEVTLQEAIDLIEAKRQDEKNKIVKVYDENPDVKILNGRYGVYIAYKGSNYKIPKTVTTPADLTLESVLDIIEHQDSKPKRKTTARRSTSTRKK